MDAVQQANSGHPGTPMALAPLGYLLYRDFLRFDPAHPGWAGRDRFVLSAGHASMLLYSLLHLNGYDLPLDELVRFRQMGSKTPGHPEFRHTPGVEVTTGPLGQGFGAAVGFAIAQKWFAARFAKPGFEELFDYRVFIVCSDGDLMEGVAAEAASLAGHLGLGNLIVFYDDNRITIEGDTGLAFSEDVCGRFRAYGWHTVSVEDGNDLEELTRATNAAASEDRPSLIRVRTHIGYGAPNKQDTAEAHGSPLGDEEIRLAKERLGWTYDRFVVPDEAREAMTAAAIEQGRARYVAWQQRFANYADTHPREAEEFQAFTSRALPKGWDEGLPKFTAADGLVATRVASGKALNALAERLPNLMGGSADLAPSTNTLIKGADDFEAGGFGGRNFRFGIREHAMGAALHGMALSGGTIPFGATFLVFSDYMRPPIRLAALSGVRFIMVYTHDSIGLGEDGPTHQPIEHLAALRAIPNVYVIRPADPNETVEAWRLAVETRDRPVLLILTRQGVPVLECATEQLRKGAYVVGDYGGDGARVALIATGSEVHLCVAAARLLAERGMASRVVSMPCWELFEEQSAAYRDSVLPPTLTARVSVEAGVTQGWERYVGPRGAMIGMNRFGESAPYQELMEKYGFTPGHIADTALSVLEDR